MHCTVPSTNEPGTTTSATAGSWHTNRTEIVSLSKNLALEKLTVVPPAMGAHAGAMGKALESAVGKYNQFVGSLESQVLTQARRFEDLSVDHEGKEIPEPPMVDQAVRPLTKLKAVGQSPTLTLGNDTPT